MHRLNRSTALFPLLFFSPLVYRAIWTDIHIYDDTATRMLGAVQVLAHDAPIFFVMGMLLYVSFLARIGRWPAMALRLMAVLIYSVYLVDLFLLVNFNTHLAITDIFKYAGYTWKYIGQLYPYLILLFVGLGLFGFVSARLVGWNHKIVSGRGHWRYGMTLTLLFILPLLRNDGQYVHGWRYQNVVEYNHTIFSEARSYSQGFSKVVAPKENPACSAHDPGKKNIILLMVESLSAYQSRLFSGINNWTPRLDAIAAQHLYFTRFLANGFTTEDGEIALLTGRLPIYGPASFTNWGGTRFRGFFQLPDALPMILKDKGYHTEYITSADLAFAQTGQWAHSIGFDYIEGHAHPYYETWQRFQFNAAPDEALYARVLDRVKQNQGNANFLLFIKTAGTHHPFINPENGRRSEEEAFLNADRQLGRFYDNLAATDFFDNGLLVIVGDHRAMVPLGRQEIQQFGALEAAARVPLVVVSKDRAAMIGERFQQTDVYNSLKNMISAERCTSPWQGDFLGERIPPEYIGFRRGDQRDLVTVFADEGAVQVKLAGDDTQIVNEVSLEPTEKAHIVSKINQVRILGDINHRQFNINASDGNAKPNRRFSYH